MAIVDENYDSSSSEDEAIFVVTIRLKAADRKTLLAKSWISHRQAQGACANIVIELNYENYRKIRTISPTGQSFI